MYLDRSQRLRVFEKLAFLTAERVVVDGVCIKALHYDTEPIIQKTLQALDLIKSNDPYRYRQITTQIGTLWIAPLFGARSVTVAVEGGAMLEPRIVLDESVQQVAAAIIHDAVRLRTIRCRVVVNDYVKRQRVERFCKQQELAFARRIPDGALLAEWVESQAALSADYWADRSFRARFAKAETEWVEHYHVPRWVLAMRKVVRWLRGWMR